ncbi:type IV toxin-antitoxin system AbiEi family antitoxin domain-containing protein [Gordonia neofelifaecis]|uniref:AbiEi antitoxin N-terminal domain-containing protein n=1 Tax=Gordonia neofelifaecis NRRL B-59395 TaxID=644548 RepID=F1YJB4_9ACTN|nr:type IV toxin-antitoxin system AbiEi family antitoxin domain-containing protein [Gordonia neofelifaecis]EGD55147.1 hypothetical protein SCNU_09754 [Gordonia neofelifaecis NRRL B-59395]
MGEAGHEHVAAARLSSLLRDQDGVVTREQVCACGLDSAFIRRRLRSGAWVRVHPGIYLTHTGPATWLQRAWCAILVAEPAALSDQSALLVASGDAQRLGGSDAIHLAIESGRRITPKRGVVFHHRSDLDAVTMTGALPPRVRVDEAVLDVAARATTELGVIAALADPVQARLTTAPRLLAALDRRARIRHRVLIHDVLTDVARGTCSALEHRFLTRVERPHGLPTPNRQAPTTAGRSGFRDLHYPDLGLIVELDGRLFHDDALARDRDMERDLDAAVFARARTLRLCWGQAAVRSCTTASKLGVVMNRLGWTGRTTPCASPECAVRQQQCSA